MSFIPLISNHPPRSLTPTASFAAQAMPAFTCVHIFCPQHACPCLHPRGAMHDAAPLSSQLPMQARPAGVDVDCACCDRAAFVGKFFALRLCYQGDKNRTYGWVGQSRRADAQFGACLISASPCAGVMSRGVAVCHITAWGPS